jgi:aryl-alcohol dehydrogenase-like predicted oxidoreductase
MMSKLILGTAQFGMSYGINNLLGKPDSDEVFKVLLTAYNNGIRKLDTAEVYGNAHELIGEFHSKYPEYKYDVITKITFGENNSVRNKVLKIIKYLRVDFLHTIMFHSYDSYCKLSENDKIELNYLKKNNFIKHIGVSLYHNSEIESVISDCLIDIIQMPYNLLDNKNQRGNIIDKIKMTEKKIHTRSAFLQGLLLMDSNTQSKIYNKFKSEISFLNEISKNLGIKLSHLALSYCVDNLNIDNVIVGVDSCDHLNEIIEFEKKSRLSLEVHSSINNIKVNNNDFLLPINWNIIE